MKKVRNSIIFYVIILIVLFCISRKVLNILDMEYRNWVFIGLFLLLGLALIILNVKHILQTKKSWIKIFFVILLIFTIGCTLLVIKFIYLPEHVIIKGDKKVVGHVDALEKSQVYYYDYINFIVRSKKLRAYEDYGEGVFDPIKNKEKYEIKYYEYYENDNEIKKSIPIYTEYINYSDWNREPADSLAEIIDYFLVQSEIKNITIEAYYTQKGKITRTINSKDSIRELIDILRPAINRNNLTEVKNDSAQEAIRNKIADINNNWNYAKAFTIYINFNNKYRLPIYIDYLKFNDLEVINDHFELNEELYKILRNLFENFN